MIELKYEHYKEMLIMSKYYSINEFSKILGVSAQTLRNWDKNGKLHPHHTSGNGYRYYSHEQLNQVMNIKPNLDRSVIGYCRVSSNKQKDDLERQIENVTWYLAAQGKPFELIEYMASLYNCDIEIIDNTEKSEQQELVEDLVQIITGFSCKLQGKRANKARKLVKELIEEGEKDDKDNSG